MSALAGVGMVPVVTPPAFSEAPACADVATDAANARKLAADCNRRVEDLSQRSEHTQVLANPDGTWTATESMRPRFARMSDGSWTTPDATLVANPDGSFSPRASVFPIKISGGGTGALAWLSKTEGAVSLSWPAAMPTPTISGATATYEEIVPGVDLRLIADVDGVSEQLVVKTHAAAANPLVRNPKFGVQVSGGLTAATHADGVSEIKDSGGKVVFSSGAARMWDSSANPVASRFTDGSDSAPEPEPKSADVAVAVAAGTWTLTPSAEMLDDPATVFPVVIDPDIKGTKNHWSLLRESSPDTEYYDITDANISDTTDNQQHGLARVGYSDWQSPTYTDRSVFEFNTTAVNGKHVLGAKLNMYQRWSGSGCGGTGGAVGVYWTSAISSATNWTNFSGSARWGSTYRLGTNSEIRRYGGTGSCAPGYIQLDFSSKIATVGLGTANTLTLGIKGENESSNTTWKRYANDTTESPFLELTYNTYPGTPADAKVDNKACGTGANAAYVSTIGGHAPQLSAKLTDSDQDASLRGDFAWTAASGATSGSQGSIPNNGYASVSTAGATFTPGATYSFTVKTWDGTDFSKASAGPCEFVVDNTKPSAKPTAISADGRYPMDDGTGGWHDGVGKAGSFTLQPNGVTDTVGYYYGLTDPPNTYVAAAAVGGNATATLTPLNVGLNTLYVRSVDRAGNQSDISSSYRFWVGSGVGPVGAWKFSEGTGAVAQDTGAGAHNITLSNTTWSTGRMATTKAGAFNATSSYGSTGTAPVLNTSQSFTLSAWVKLTDTTSSRFAVSTQGVHCSSFFLYYDKPANKWAFQQRTADTTTAQGAYALSTTVPKLNVWTHLAGVYDAPSAQMRLYINGVLEKTVAVSSVFNASGPLVVGRFRQADVDSGYWAGGVSEVRAWDRIVTDAEIAEQSAPVLVAQWDLDDGAGSTAFDSSVFSHPATLSGAGATWSTTGHNFDDLGSVTFNGSTGYASTNGAVLNTDQSFTVTAWVNPTSLPAYITILSQKGTTNSGAILQYEAGSGWCLTAQVNDSLNPPGATRAKSGTAVVQAGAWQHVAGVYDAQKGEMRIYVNGVLKGSAAVTIGWNASGQMQLGRELFSGNENTSPFPGSIDAVRVYQGVLPDSQITAQAAS
ncbi:hypothetical protein HDA40_007941 [Hamadaea flava]|uniref:LamG domain-containing protein n=1 Tax=Hamadaea flava TaxID=1742688 RepID=A0ABV8LYC7_9ACTN|nr:LamG domain-containing protein [Hamadaea flava]MCP2329434.1 hypothetical protein [Hamadaea flava]